ncbi:MAG: lytic transglycosylase domain-containing protein [Thermoanaerobacteraceae bacterium]|nr:lytic transglycosylase domain-containing protein [Thermoanaerobacteraceae bacterium]
MFLLLLAVVAALLAKPTARLVYPFPYRSSILHYAGQNGLDPLLVLAVVRTESKFYPLAESLTGARGLMQIMPETARWVAGRLREEFDPERLFEPEYNLRLGTWYLAYLIREFRGSLPAALAAYNGGSQNVEDWLGRGVWDGRSASLDKIPFPETREFVRQVLRDYRIYRFLYPEPGR